MKRILLTISTILAGGLFMAHAQNVSDLIISEVLAEPDSSCIMDAVQGGLRFSINPKVRSIMADVFCLMTVTI